MMKKGSNGIRVGKGAEADSLEGLISRVKWLEADVQMLKEQLDTERRNNAQTAQMASSAYYRNQSF